MRNEYFKNIFFHFFSPTEIKKAHLLYKEKNCQSKICWKFEPFDNYLEELNTNDVYFLFVNIAYISSNSLKGKENIFKGLFIIYHSEMC